MKIYYAIKTLKYFKNIMNTLTNPEPSKLCKD